MSQRKTYPSNEEIARMLAPLVMFRKEFTVLLDQKPELTSSLSRVGVWVTLTEGWEEKFKEMVAENDKRNAIEAIKTGKADPGKVLYC